MKKLLKPVLMLVSGVALGGGSAYGVTLLLPQGKAGPQAAAESDAKPEPTAFVQAPPMIVPVANADGLLSGYVQIVVQVEVKAESAEAVAAQMPLLLHEVNMRMWSNPIAAGPEEMLPDPRRFSRVAHQAAQKALGAKAVRATIVSDIKPI